MTNDKRGLTLPSPKERVLKNNFQSPSPLEKDLG
jgi:hypothetical protein